MFASAAKLTLAPLLLAQGMGVRKRALILPEAPGPRDGVAGQGPLLRLLIVGDSSAAGVGAADQDEALAGQLVARLARRFQVEWRLIARTGATTASTLRHLERVPAGNYDLALVVLGVNDVTHGVPLGRWLAQQAELRGLLHGRFAVRRVLSSGLPPMGAFPALPQPLRWVMGASARRFDRALAEATAAEPFASHLAFDLGLEPGLMAADGFHPGPAGYALWAEQLAPALAALAPV